MELIKHMIINFRPTNPDDEKDLSALSECYDILMNYHKQTPVGKCANPDCKNLHRNPVYSRNFNPSGRCRHCDDLQLKPFNSVYVQKSLLIGIDAEARANERKRIHDKLKTDGVQIRFKKSPRSGLPKVMKVHIDNIISDELDNILQGVKY